MTNKLSTGAIHEAAIRRLHQWVVDGEPAPSQPRIEIQDGRPAQIVRDELGNAVGGIRLPEMAAPTAEHRGMSFGTGNAPLFGASRPFPEDVLRRMYPTRDDFERKWESAVDDLVFSGAVLPEDVPAMKARCRDVELPVDGPATLA